MSIECFLKRCLIGGVHKPPSIQLIGNEWPIDNEVVVIVIHDSSACGWMMALCSAGPYFGGCEDLKEDTFSKLRST